ncbi:DUF3887 domain-containing protein [Acinetobacter sp. NCu2D-2]|uniref:DUF3887 domain-containing protein n=1 Tax=Acinetobacter sp. NCu2D-2 TaxID=1608473 RepID=UPI0007CDACD1|nr:DUF3887 domain-containing protein [Acinetobacter sp. NCu2D-2]ANF82197.1 DUF3887 domain-containing protein [Acinetobacter sp. NCu2D-2]
MYKTIGIYAAGLALAACNPMKDIPNPSSAQEKAAEVAYNDLRDGKFVEFLQHLEPELQAYLQDNEKIMKKFSHQIPKGAYKSKALMVKEITKSTSSPVQYRVSYEIAYPKNLVQYDVSFDKPNGSTKIRNFNIQVFGGS